VVIVVNNSCCVVDASYQAAETDTSGNEVTRGYDYGQETR